LKGFELVPSRADNILNFGTPLQRASKKCEGGMAELIHVFELPLAPVIGVVVSYFFTKTQYGKQLASRAAEQLDSIYTGWTGKHKEEVEALEAVEEPPVQQIEEVTPEIDVEVSQVEPELGDMGHTSFWMSKELWIGIGIVVIVLITVWVLLYWMRKWRERKHQESIQSAIMNRLQLVEPEFAQELKSTPHVLEGAFEQFVVGQSDAWEKMQALQEELKLVNED
jgi:hypothetical protein